MKSTLPITLLASLLVLTAGLFGQNTIPAGTILPLQLNSSLNSKKSKPGQVVTARLMQDVPLPLGRKIKAGSKAVGRILDVVEAKHGAGAQLSVQFDTLVVSQRRIPITTNLRALASMMAVAYAQLPNTGPDSGTSEYEYVTDQIGGDVVYGRGGSVTNGLQVVENIHRQWCTGAGFVQTRHEVPWRGRRDGSIGRITLPALELRKDDGPKMRCRPLFFFPP